MDNQENQKANGLRNPRKMRNSNKGFLIFLCIIAGVIFLAVMSSFINVGSYISIPFVGNDTQEVIYEDYIAQLYIEGGIYSDPSGTGYDHEWTMAKVDALMEDDNNKGLLLYIDSPGGEVYVGDELYLKLLQYKEETGRPVYAYFASTAASGAYYISCAADKIIANRNCVTGSIGVKIGTFYDLTELLEKYGVDAFDIASGSHKNMGSYFETMDDEEIGIYQDIVDESYEQFVDIIVAGRGLDRDAVYKLADGRIYTASQALKLGLVDEIAGYDEAVRIMLADLDADFDVIEMQPDYEYSIFDILYLLSSAQSNGKTGSAGTSTLLMQSDNLKLFFER